MSKHAIILYYEGSNPPQALISHVVEHVAGACKAELQSIVVKHYDEDSIINAIGNDAIRKIVFNKEAEQQEEVGTVKVCFSPGPSKLRVIKFIKETFNMPLREVKDAVDTGIIMVPQTTDVYQFVKDLCTNGGCIVNGSDVYYAVAQAAVFINSRYPGIMQIENLVKDFAMAKYHDTVNATDDIEKALLNTVQIVKEHPDLIQEWIGSDKVKTITML